MQTTPHHIMKKMKIDNIIIQIIGNWIDQMQKKNWLLEEDREYYQYAMEVRLEEILTIATVFFVIICMRQFVNGLTFLVSFLTLRKRTGGFHMKTFEACYMATVGTFVAVIFVAKYVHTYSKIGFICTCIASVYVVVIGTVNNPDIDMNNSELSVSKKCARIVLTVELLIVIVGMRIKKCKEIVIMISLAIILCSILMKFAQLKYQEKMS